MFLSGIVDLFIDQLLAWKSISIKRLSANINLRNPILNLSFYMLFTVMPENSSTSRVPTAGAMRRTFNYF